jgi:hypothetical protein
MTRNWRLFLTGAIAAVLTFTISWSQASVQSTSFDKTLDTVVPVFQLENETFVKALWKLAKGPAPFAFGFEDVLGRKIADPKPPDPAFNSELGNKTVRQILDTLCQLDGRFQWSVDNTVVNVYPRAVVNDPNYLLNRTLGNFELKNATDVQYGLLAIVRQLPPPEEQIAQAQAGGADPYPPDPWSVTYHNVTVRQVINRLALHGGPCGIWLFKGADDFRAFGFFNTNLSCPAPSKG